MALIGYQRNESTTLHILNIIRKTSYLLSLIFMIIAVFWFIAFDANTFAELANQTFIFSNGIIVVAILITYLRRFDEFYGLFDKLEVTIQQRLQLGETFRIIFPIFNKICVTFWKKWNKYSWWRIKGTVIQTNQDRNWPYGGQSWNFVIQNSCAVVCLPKNAWILFWILCIRVIGGLL